MKNNAITFAALGTVGMFGLLAASGGVLTRAAPRQPVRIFDRDDSEEVYAAEADRMEAAEAKRARKAARLAAIEAKRVSK